MTSKLVTLHAQAVTHTSHAQPAVAPGRSHRWVIGPDGPRQEQLAAVAGPAAIATHAHHKWGGPYTAGGQLARALTPLLLERVPRLAARHDIELLTMAPDLEHMLPATHATLDTMTGVAERTRLFPAERTRWIAHGVADLLQAWAAVNGPVVVIVDHADRADPTDAQLLAVLLRRLSGPGVTIVVGSASSTVPADLADALETHAARQELAHAAPASAADALAAARRYIASDGIDGDGEAVAVWEALDPAIRAGLHDRRADALEAGGEFPPRLGAIPWHRMHGSDPDGTGMAAVHWALEHCLLAGFFDAAVSLARDEYERLDWQQDPNRCWVVGSKLCAALIGLGRVDEAGEVYLDARLETTDPDTQMQSAYGEAMLRTRHYDRDRRDHRQAKGWLQVALTIADLLPDPEERAVAKTFYGNALALVEVHLRRPDEALRLVTDGRARLDQQLTAEQWRLHRSVLGHNLARVHAQTGDLDAALAEYTSAIGVDPNYPDYRLERGNVHRRRGDLDAALRDYTTAIEIGLPCPQASYNRGDLALELGTVELARRDFDRTLELDDSYVDAWLNRAALRLDDSDLDGAAADIAAGLERDPENPHLHCLRGTLAAERGDLQSAASDQERAVELDPGLAGAWANLGALRWANGDVDAALRDFDRSLKLEDNADVRANRELALLDRYPA